MSLSKLKHFQTFQLDEFCKGKKLAFLKANPWEEWKDKKIVGHIGSEVVLMIMEDKTDYNDDYTSNLHETMNVRVKDRFPEDFAKMQPLQTPVEITDVEWAYLGGERSNELRIQGNVIPAGGTSAPATAKSADQSK